MSGKLDQSLDDILKTSRRSAAKGGRGRGGRRVSRPGKPAAATAPVGGIKKQTKGAVKAVPTGPAGSGISKIQVSNLPTDAAVNEGTIKEYFNGLQLGPVKRVEMSYGPNGNSRGIATITFARSDSAAKAVEKCRGVRVDGTREMKIEVLLDARQVAAIPPPKGLSERITGPKNQPKSAVPTKNGTGSARGKARGAKKARNPRPAKKTAEELDSEMADYWESGANGGEAAATNGAAANGDANMDEEIL